MALLRSWIALIIAVTSSNILNDATIAVAIESASTIKETRKSTKARYFRHLQEPSTTIQQEPSKQKQKQKQDGSISSSTASLFSYYGDNNQSSTSTSFFTPSSSKEETPQQQQQLTTQASEKKQKQQLPLEEETPPLQEESLPSSSSTSRSELESVPAAAVSSEKVAEAQATAPPTLTPAQPTVAPTIPIYNEMVQGELIFMYCKGTLPKLSQINFEDITATHVRRSVMEQHLKAKPLAPLTDLRVQVEIDTQYLYPDKEKINSDKDVIQISFSAFTSYRSILPYYEGNTSTENIVSMLRNGFEDDERRTSYIQNLKKTGDPYFELIEQLLLIEVGGEPLSYDDTLSRGEYNLKPSLLSQIINKNQRDEQPPSPLSSPQLGIQKPPKSQENSVGFQQPFPDMQIWIIVGSLAAAVALISLTLILSLKTKGVTSSILGSNKGRLDGTSTSAGSNNSSPSVSPSSSRLSSVVDSTPKILVQNSGEDISTLGDPIMYSGGFRNGGNEMDEITASIGNDYDYLEYAMKLKHQQTGAGVGESNRSIATSTFTENNHKNNSSNALSYLSSPDDGTRNTRSDESLGTSLRRQMQMMNNQSEGGTGTLFFEEDDLSLDEQYNY